MPAKIKPFFLSVAGAENDILNTGGKPRKKLLL